MQAAKTAPRKKKKATAEWQKGMATASRENQPPSVCPSSFSKVVLGTRRQSFIVSAIDNPREDVDALVLVETAEESIARNGEEIRRGAEVPRIPLRSITPELDLTCPDAIRRLESESGIERGHSRA